MSSLFYNCSSLKSYPDISKWNTINVHDINSMFFNNTSLLTLPDISKWNIINVRNISSLFKNCSEKNKKNTYATNVRMIILIYLASIIYLN